MAQGGQRLRSASNKQASKEASLPERGGSTRPKPDRRKKLPGLRPFQGCDILCMVI
jgi:hypothetical protein